MTGILLVDKPSGWTSFDVVNYVRKIVANEEGKKPKNIKVGHCGTLDPFATGLLILLIGKEYTSQAQNYTKLDKTYEITMHFGAKSSTGDPEGELTQLPGPKITEPQLNSALEMFTGVILQKPPIFSAIKVNGQRAYKLARAGQQVDLEPREITINDIKLKNLEYPIARIVASVSSGTYIRSLVEDIAHSLKTSAYTEVLRRTVVGDFSVDNAIQIDGLTAAKINKNLIEK